MNKKFEHIKNEANSAAIIVAAGTGTRFGGDLPKQFLMLGGKQVLRHSIDAFANHHAFNTIILVVAKGQQFLARNALGDLATAIHIVIGGSCRRESVANGLAAIPQAEKPDYVFIHDAARPGLTSANLNALFTGLEHYDGAVPVLNVPDSMARTENGALGETIERSGLVRIQTPQAFRTEAILKAHTLWPPENEATDDARMLMAIGGKVAAIPGCESLRKLTYEEDMSMLAVKSGSDMRIGQGYDVHRLEMGQELWLCGIKLDHTHGLSGHSDADVALHALTDAIFGAIGDGDIGTHFPPSEPEWRDAESRKFLEYAAHKACEEGYAISNLDLTIICEAPKIGPHRQIMREKLAEILKIDMNRISIKATTTERLGFTGRKEGIAAQAIVLLSAS